MEKTLAILAIIAISSGGAHSQQTHAKIIRKSQGVIFTPRLKQVINGQSHFFTTFEIPIPWASQNGKQDKIMQGKTFDNIKSGEYPQATAAMFEMITHYNKHLQDMKQALLTQDREINHILPAKKITGKRGLFDFLGLGLTYVLGVANIGQINNLWGAINNISHATRKSIRQNAINSKFLWLQANVTANKISILNSRLNLHENFTQKLQKAIIALKVHQQSADSQIKEVIMNLQQINLQRAATAHYLDALNYITDKINEQNNFIEAIILLGRGTISPRLIRPSDMKNALERIAQVLLKTHPQYKVLHTDNRHYFTAGLHSYSYAGKSLFISISVPISATDIKYTLYDLQTIPIATVTHPQQAYNGYTIVTNLPSALAMNNNGNDFLQLSNDELDKCTDSEQIWCMATTAVYSRRAPTCAIAIFLNDTINIANRCNVRYLSRKLPGTTVLKLSGTEFLFSTMITKHTLVCKDGRLQTGQNSRYTSFSIPCDCHLILDHTHLYTTFTDCNPATVTLKLTHAVNNYVINAFNVTLPHADFSENSTDPMKILIPSIDELISKENELKQKNTQQDITLNDIAQAFKRQSLANKNTPTWASTFTLSEQGQQAMDIAVNCIFGACHAVEMIAIILIYRKYITAIGATTAITASIAKQALNAQATIILRPNNGMADHKYTTYVPEAMVTTDPAGGHAFLITTAVIGACLIIMTIMWCFKDKITSTSCVTQECTNTSRSRDLHLHIEVSNTRERHILQLQRVQVCQNLVQIASRPTLSTITYIKGKIILLWDGPMTITINNRETKLNLAKFIPVHFTLRRKIERIIQREIRFKAPLSARITCPVTVRLFMSDNMQGDPAMEIPLAHYTDTQKMHVTEISTSTEDVRSAEPESVNQTEQIAQVHATTDGATPQHNTNGHSEYMNMDEAQNTLQKRRARPCTTEAPPPIMARIQKVKTNPTPTATPEHQEEGDPPGRPTPTRIKQQTTQKIQYEQAPRCSTTPTHQNTRRSPQASTPTYSMASYTEGEAQ